MSIVSSEPPGKRIKTENIPGESDPTLYSGNILEYARKKRDLGQFNDVVIKTLNKSIYANKVIISSQSEFLEEKCLEADKKNETEITINDVDENALEGIITFCYSEKIVIDTNNVKTLLQAASSLKVPKIKELCLKELVDTLTVETCFHNYDVVVVHGGDRTILRTIFQFIHDHFDEALKRPEYKRWKKDCLLSFLKLKLQLTANQAYKFITKWIDHNRGHRAGYISHLCLLVDLNKLDIALLKDYMQRKSNLEKPKKRESIVTLSSNESGRVASQIKIGKIRGRRVLSVGGMLTMHKVEIVYQGFHESSEQTFPNLPKDCFWGCAAEKERVIYYFGGCVNGNGSIKNVWTMDTKKDPLKWKDFPGLNQERHQTGVSIFKGELVIMGGRENLVDTKSVLTSGEYFLKASNDWKSMPCMQQARAQHGLVTCNGKLYAIGGYDREEKALDSAECLNEITGQWKPIRSMAFQRSRLAVVECNGYIYAIGGRYDWDTVLNTAERYDVSTNEWSPIGSMKYKRSGFSACVMEQRIFVFGGFNGDDEIVKEIEYYDTMTRSWVEIPGLKTKNELVHHSVLTI